MFSLFGILLVFMIGRFNANRPAMPAESTPTPFKYQLIGTEPGISTAEITLEPGSGDSGFPNLGLVVTAQQGGSSGSGSSAGTDTNATPLNTSSSSDGGGAVATSGTSPIIILNPGTRTATQSFGIIQRTFTPSRTPGPTITLTPSRTKSITSTSGSSITNTSVVTATGATQVPLAPGTYDDSHPLIAYNGWSIITDGTAYQSTLHVSNTAGSTITFRFTGQQIRLKFQGSGSFGVIRINIGGLNFDLDEANGTDEWVSAMLAQGTYTVVITHTSGGSVNIDSIIIPDFSPTATVTGTPPTVTPSLTSAPGSP